MEAALSNPAPRHLRLRFVVWSVAWAGVFLALYLSINKVLWLHNGGFIIFPLIVFANLLLPTPPRKQYPKFSYSWDEICITLGVIGAAGVFIYLLWTGAFTSSVFDALLPLFGNAFFLLSLWLISIASVWRGVCKRL